MDGGVTNRNLRPPKGPHLHVQQGALRQPQLLLQLAHPPPQPLVLRGPGEHGKGRGRAACGVRDGLGSDGRVSRWQLRPHWSRDPPSENAPMAAET
jgi:hypothetical protein